MLITKNEQICYFDVDQTLVNWVSGSTVGALPAMYYGERVHLTPIDQHIRFLKSMKARGAYIIVHSGNGWAWAEQVVKLLRLEYHVDEVKTKPYKIIDDSDYINWMPTRIFIEE